MNLQDDTIQLLVNLVEREQRWLDQSQPDCQDYDHRFRALLDRFADDKAMRKELLGLTDLHELSAAATSVSFSGRASSWGSPWAVLPFCPTTCRINGGWTWKPSENVVF